MTDSARSTSSARDDPCASSSTLWASAGGTASGRFPALAPAGARDRALTAGDKEHFAGLATTEGVLAEREGDVAAYVKARGSAREGATLEAEETDEKRTVSMSTGEEEEEWTYPDGGTKAWLCVFGTFVFCCAQLGWGMAWGVLLQDLEKRMPEYPASTLNFISSLCNTGMNITAFFAGRAGDKFGFKRVIAAGAAMNFLCLIFSALCFNNLPGLFIIQGALLGCSQGLGMPLFMAISSQWFLKRRGLATGLATSGSGIGGGITSLILRGTITLGYRNAMLIYAGTSAVAFVVGFVCLTERHPPLKPGETRVAKNWLPSGVWSDGKFWSLMGSLGVAVFGFLCPFYFITALTKANCPQYDPDSLILAAPLIVGSIVSGFGRIFSGVVADVIGPVNTLFCSFFFGGLFQIAIWPHMHSFGLIMAFACLYGFVGSWFVSMLPPASAQLFGTKGLATIVGFGVLCNTPGQFIGGPIGGWVLSAAGNDYGMVAYYAGSVQLLGAVILLYARFKGNPKLWARY